MRKIITDGEVMSWLLDGKSARWIHDNHGVSWGRIKRLRGDDDSDRCTDRCTDDEGGCSTPPQSNTPMKVDTREPTIMVKNWPKYQMVPLTTAEIFKLPRWILDRLRTRVGDIND